MTTWFIFIIELKPDFMSTHKIKAADMFLWLLKTRTGPGLDCTNQGFE